MKRIVQTLLIAFILLRVVAPIARADDLSRVSADELMTIYAQLRQLHSGDRWSETEDVVLRRDAGTFTFRTGKMVFAAPVNGRIVAAAFEGQGSFELNPPSPIDQAQIARFTGSPQLTDTFREAVFFFTDDSLDQFRGQMKIQESGAPAMGTIATTQKDFIRDNNDWWSNQSKGNFEMQNVAARMLADLADPSSKGFFLAAFKADKAGDLIFHVSWNRDPLLLPGLSNDEEVMLLHYSRGNWYEWRSGFHLAEEYTQARYPEHRQLLVRCPRQTIGATISDDNRLSATAEMDYEVLRGSPRLLPLNLRGVLRISSVKEAEGRPLAFIQEPREFDSDPWIILPAPAVEGFNSRLTIEYAENSTYDSRIIHQRGSGLYYVTARTSWYPNFGAFDDKTEFTLRFRSPKKLSFVATGTRLQFDAREDETRSEWHSEVPFAVAGFNYGKFVEKSRSDSNLTVTAFSGKEIPDELKQIQSQIRMYQLQQGVRAPGDVAGLLGLAEGGLNTSQLASQAADVSYGALSLFRYYFGPLAFKTVSVTEQPVYFYGQSWPTLIYLPYSSFLDSTTRHGLQMDPSAEAVEFYNTVVPHEVAHQWWGHQVGWKTYHEAWISEGISEFAAAVWLSKADPKEVRSFWDLKRRRLLGKNSNGNRPNDVGPLWLSLQLPTYSEPRLYQELVYFKGAYVMEMLCLYMSDPRQKEPDARFINMMRDFAATYRGQNASTEDFRRVVEKDTGEPMDWFFDQWVYGTEVPSYSLQYDLKPSANGTTNLSFRVTQSGVSDQFRGFVPIDLILKGRVERLALVKITGSKTISGNVSLSVKPDKVTLDETHSILCESRD